METLLFPDSFPGFYFPLPESHPCSAPSHTPRPARTLPLGLSPPSAAPSAALSRPLRKLRPLMKLRPPATPPTWGQFRNPTPSLLPSLYPFPASMAALDWLNWLCRGRDAAQPLSDWLKGAWASCDWLIRADSKCD